MSMMLFRHDHDHFCLYFTTYHHHFTIITFYDLPPIIIISCHHFASIPLPIIIISPLLRLYFTTYFHHSVIILPSFRHHSAIIPPSFPIILPLYFTIQHLSSSFRHHSVSIIHHLSSS